MPRVRIPQCYVPFVFLGLVLTASAADLFHDDFSAYPAGWLSMPIGIQGGAIQEYHYFPHRGVPLGPWANAICHMDAWLIGEEDGKPYLEQQLSPSSRSFGFTAPIFVTGDSEWGDYSVEADVRPLSFDGMAGLVFRYHTNRHYYAFALTDGTTARLVLRLPLEKSLAVPEWRELARTDFRYDCKRYYRLRIDNEGPRMRAYVDGKLVLEASDSEILRGKAGLTAAVPTRFERFSVGASAEVKATIDQRIRLRDAELSRLRVQNPRPKLWRKFSTAGFGAGRNVRFGDLDGDGVPDMLIAQTILKGGDFQFEISCLTALTLEGKVLWQIGRPNPRNTLVTGDSPFQIHDVDGDGRNEVVLVKDFKLQILDGRTGKVKRWIWTPNAPPTPDRAERPYDLNIGNSIAFVNVLGDKARHEVLLKDEYKHFWVYNSRLELLWKGEGQTGHYPYPFEVDGHDEIAIGYQLVDHNGRCLWSRDADFKDHADGVMMGNLSGDPKAEPRVYASGSDEGFILLDRHGRTLKHVRVGHAQSPSVAKYRSDVPGLQYMTINFWRNPGIVTLFDYNGNILEQEEPIHTGSPLLPVNWRGDGQEFALLSGNVLEGGMLDGHLRRVVMFPDDGHPDLAAAVLDVTGDPRDEVFLWNQDEVWIYTQDRPFTGEKIYAPVRNPLYNDSNYRIVASFPGWMDSKELKH
jgi:rhamnogalacturonan endolyase